MPFPTTHPALERALEQHGYLEPTPVQAAVLADVFPDHAIEAALVWTDGPKLMPIPEFLLAQSLASLGRGG